MYIYCMECRRGYWPSECSPGPSAHPGWTTEEVPFRHKVCPEGHPFTGEPTWQTEEQYRQDREHERKTADQA